MKNTFVKTVGRTVLAILMLSTFTLVTVYAQSATSQGDNGGVAQKDLSDGPQNSRNLVGSWNHQGMRINCQTGAVLSTFPAMFTFNSDGTFWEAGTQLSPSLRSASHGVWSYESRGLYATAFQFFRFNADGTLAGRQIVRQQLELSADGTSYTTTAMTQVLDVNGNVISTGCAAGSGTRFE